MNNNPKLFGKINTEGLDFVILVANGQGLIDSQTAQSETDGSIFVTYSQIGLPKHVAENGTIKISGHRTETDRTANTKIAEVQKQLNNIIKGLQALDKVYFATVAPGLKLPPLKNTEDPNHETQ